jgi:hypothetical protein
MQRGSIGRSRCAWTTRLVVGRRCWRMMGSFPSGTSRMTPLCSSCWTLRPRHTQRQTQRECDRENGRQRERMRRREWAAETCPRTSARVRRAAAKMRWRHQSRSWKAPKTSRRREAKRARETDTHRDTQRENTLAEVDRPSKRRAAKLMILSSAIAVCKIGGERIYKCPPFCIGNALLRSVVPPFTARLSQSSMPRKLAVSSLSCRPP